MSMKKTKAVALAALALMAAAGTARGTAPGILDGAPRIERTLRQNPTSQDPKNPGFSMNVENEKLVYEYNDGSTPTNELDGMTLISFSYVGSGTAVRIDGLDEVFDKFPSYTNMIVELYTGQASDVDFGNFNMENIEGVGVGTPSLNSGTPYIWASRGTVQNSLNKTFSYTFSGLQASSLQNDFSLRVSLYNLKGELTDGETAEVYVNVDDPLTIDQILANVSAQDLLGEEVEVRCTEDEKAKYKPDTIGTYKVTVTATDRYGQTATCYLNVHVVDVADPTIELVGDLSFSTGETLAFADIGDYVRIADNGTEHGGTLGNPTYTIDGEPFTEDRTWGPADVGSHTLKVTVADSSGNSATKDFPISVSDDEPPVVTMRDGGEGTLLIGLSRVLSFTETEFLALFQATDNVTPPEEIELDVEGAFIPSKVGAYDVVVKATDGAGNVGRLTCHVTVDADLPPVFILSDALVGATAGNPLTSAQIQAIVVNGLYAGEEVADVLIDDAAYQAGRTEAGSYPVAYSVRVAEADGSLRTETGSLTIRVSDASAGDGEEEPSGWAAFCMWWQKLKNWFRGVFTKFEFDCFISDAEWDERFPAETAEEGAE